MKVMTYNVQHCQCEQTDQIDLCLFARLLQSGADVIGVNEIYEDQARILAEKTDMNLHFAGAIRINGGFYGNAVLSRLPILSAGTVPVPDPPEKRYSGYYETRCAANCLIAAGRTDVQFDYIFVSKDITVAAADIPAVVASDHRTHTAELIL